MNQNINIEKVMKHDQNFLIGLKLPELEIYLTWNGGKFVEYHAYRDGKLLFHGVDFKPSPLHNVDSLETLCDLLGFLTCKPGDTDSDYFKNYTEDQQKWAQSYDCENLQGLVYDYESGDGQYYREAKAVFEAAIIH